MTSATFVPQTAVRPSSPLTIRSLTLALVWLAVASGAIVFSEPAPVDALTMMLIVALPIVGLVSIRPLLLGLFAAALVAAATAFFATLISYDTHTSATHSLISLYLYAAAFVFGAFVAQDPVNRVRFIMGAYICAAFVAAGGRHGWLLPPRAGSGSSLHEVRPRGRHLQGPERLWRVSRARGRLRVAPCRHAAAAAHVRAGLCVY